jgi:hypothetical protein
VPSACASLRAGRGFSRCKRSCCKMAQGSGRAACLARRRGADKRRASCQTSVTIVTRPRVSRVWAVPILLCATRHCLELRHSSLALQCSCGKESRACDNRKNKHENLAARRHGTQEIAVGTAERHHVHVRAVTLSLYPFCNISPSLFDPRPRPSPLLNK